MSAVTAVFFDIGGVLLTKGWDRGQRRATINSFSLDWEEFAYRHDSIAPDFSIGRVDLDEYLYRTIFYRDRGFTRPEFVAAMKAHSREIEGSLDIVAELAATDVSLATLNNESRELNEHRIEAFGLRRFFPVFLSSCYLGVKKPDRMMYRLALEITQRSPEECLFVDDRPLNIECALDVGMTGIQFEDAPRLRADLVNIGLLS